MAELITLVVMAILALVSGSGITLLLCKQKKLSNRRSTFFSWFLCCYFEYWLLNVFRTMIYKGNAICPYADDIYLLVFDIAILLVGAFVVYYWHEEILKRYILVRILLCITVVIYHIVSFTVQYFRYYNVNAAIYNGLIHNNATWFGVALFACYLLLSRLLEVNSNKEKKEWKTATASISLFIITMYLYPVMETYIMNAQEFSFAIIQVWHWFLAIFIVACALLGLGYYLTKGKLAELYLFFLWSVSICGYIQQMFLNDRLFLMDGKKAEWSEAVKLVNLLIWCVIFLALLVCFKLLKKKRKEILTFSSALLCVMQVVGLISLIPNYVGNEDNSNMTQEYLSEQGIFEVATDENILIFVLDTYDVDYIDRILEENPDFLAPLKGFTYYKDTVSQFSRTFPSITYMLTNEKYFYEIPKQQYVDNAFDHSVFWDSLEQKGFEHYLYVEDEAYLGETVKKSAKNYVEQAKIIDEKISFKGCVEAIVRMNYYRLFPYVLKGYYNYTAETISNLVVEKRIWDTPKYVIDDIELYKNLRENGLAVSEDKKAFRFIHLNGSHEPYNMAADGTRMADWEGTVLEQNMGCMNLVYDYLQKLQELGAYKNSTIIITADHGENYVTTQLEQNTNPILFIKPYGVGAEEELKISEVFASQNDIIPTIAELHGIDYDTLWGLNLFSTQAQDKNRVRFHYYAVVENTVQTKARTYEIKGSSLDFENWYATDEYREFGEYYP